MSSLINAYLSKCLQKLTSRCEGLTVVLGNEAGDMDSIIGAIFLAMHLDSAAQYKMTPAIPVINFPLDELPLRVDVDHLFREVGVDMSLLISVAPASAAKYSDNYLDLPRVLPKVVLYDHNKLSASQNFLSSNVVGVVDHHFDEKLYMQQSKALRVIETVGSACTLVAEIYQKAGAVVASPILLLSAIILDTVNFDAEQKKTKPKDLKIFDWLASTLTEGVDSHQVFEKLSSWRNDIFSLTLEQNFIRDYKVFNFEDAKGGGLNIGFSSVPCSYETFKSRYPCKEIASSCHCLLWTKKLDAFIICFAGKKDRIHTRDIAFVVKTEDLPVFLQYTTLFRPKIVFSPTDRFAVDESHQFVAFSLNDSSLSRKKLVPSLSNFFKGNPQSPLTKKTRHSLRTKRDFLNFYFSYGRAYLISVSEKMARGNQRELARLKAIKKEQDKGKGQRNDGLSAAQRKEIDAERMRRKQAEAEAKRSGTTVV